MYHLAIRNLTVSTASLITRAMSTVLPRRDTEELKNLKTISVTSPKPYVYHVELNRPDKYNAISKQMWIEVKECFDNLHINPDCRAIILSGAGKHFTAGLDLTSMMKLGEELGEIEEVSRKGYVMEPLIRLYQDSVSSLENCQKPVIAAIHSACIGAGVDFVTAADIRYSTKDAWFQIKEVDIGMAADVGTLQRFPKAIGSQSLARELCLTGRKFLCEEALKCGLVSRVFENKKDLVEGSLELASLIASKSPIAVQATKNNMVYSLDHTNQEGLDNIRLVNKLNLQSEDFLAAVTAQLTKGETPNFAKL